MTDIVFMFEVHQPYRISREFRDKLGELIAREGRVTPEALEDIYFDNNLNRFVFERAARRCYLPANEVILNEIDRYRYENRKFKVSYSISGVFLEQAEKWMPEVIDSFKRLVDTGMVEFLDQTYYHSLASVFSEGEFIEQVREHRRIIKDLFGVEPTAVENTEFIYNNRVAHIFAQLGYRVVFTEGVERVLGWRSPNYVYKARGSDIRVLMRNYRLSDDIGFRFAARWWEEYPLTADKYSAWLAHTPGDVINLCMDYETFGEHFPAETGIFEFLRWLPGEILKWEHLNFATPTEAAERNPVRDEIDVPEHMTISWADLERDLTAWLMNNMQWNAFSKVVKLEKPIKILGDKGFLRLWRLLMISDHLYYMNTKGGGPGDVHTYFSPYGTALEAYVVFSDVFSDLESRVFKSFEEDYGMRSKWIWARNVPQSKVFVFYRGWDQPLGWKASNMDELLWCIERAPIESIEFHHSNNHFVKWVREVVGDNILADRLSKVSGLNGEELRKEIIKTLVGRRDEIFSS